MSRLDPPLGVDPLAEPTVNPVAVGQEGWALQLIWPNGLRELIYRDDGGTGGWRLPVPADLVVLDRTRVPDELARQVPGSILVTAESGQLVFRNEFDGTVVRSVPLPPDVHPGRTRVIDNGIVSGQLVSVTPDAVVVRSVFDLTQQRSVPCDCADADLLHADGRRILVGSIYGAITSLTFPK